MERTRICNRTFHESRSQNCVDLYHLEHTSYVVPIYGVISPVLLMVTIVTNCLVCVVLVRKNMRSPTNALLVAMAISDTLTGVCPLPFFLYFYTAGHYLNYVPYSWCFAYVALSDFLPTIFHTASIWLTVALAVQRYSSVCGHGTKGNVWAAKGVEFRKVIRVIVAIYVIAALSQICRFFETTTTPVYMLWNQTVVAPDVAASFDDDQLLPAGCEMGYVPFILKHIHLYFNIYYWFRVIFIHLIPCIVLAVVSAMLVSTMRIAHARRKQLMQQSRNSESRRLAESNLTTKMLVVVVCLFLLVELPLAVFFVLFISQNTFNIGLLSADAQRVTSVVINLFIMLSYPFNFFIYCGMSNKFRSTFKQIVCCSIGGGKHSRSVKDTETMECRTI